MRDFDDVIPRAPRRRRRSNGRFIFAVLCLGLALIVAAIVSSNGRGPGAPVAPKWDRSPAAQVEREKLIGKLMATDVIDKIDSRAKGCTIWVKEGFYLATFQQKESFVRAIYAYEFSDTDNVARLNDYRTGKQIGSFTPAFGLSLD